MEAGASNGRNGLFISHASPEDNPFAVWLGSKLAAMGYEVWADVLSLRGGFDWQRRLEQAIRTRARKVLLVANPVAVEKQGVRNEIQIASDVARAIDDKEFIIPLRLERFDAPFLIAHAQYVDFQHGWAVGLAELLSTLEETYKIPRQSGDYVQAWREVQLIHAKSIARSPERLISNWLAVSGLPSKIRIYDFKGGVSIGQKQMRIKDSPWPAVEFKRGFISLAPLHDLQDHFGVGLPLEVVADCDVETFLDQGWKKQGIAFDAARRYFTDLSRQAFEKALRSHGLSSYELSERQIAWWASDEIAPTGRVGFRWGDISGSRLIKGFSKKRNMHWHFGVTMSFRAGPIRHARVVARLIFTSDGQKPFADVRRMHRLRRSFAKSWRNPRWRDMLLGFLYWLAEGKSELLVPVAADECLAFRLPPMTWMSPVSIATDVEEEEVDEDDPSDDEADEEADGNVEESDPDDDP